MPFTLSTLTADEAASSLDALTHLLRDVVDGGASIGFLPPLAEDEARAYWQGVVTDMRAGTRVLLVAREDGAAGPGEIIGAAQLDLPTKPNARHRAEVQKVMTLSAARRQGVGRALMLAIEPAARQHGRTLLVLDTRQGDDAERLYRALGYIQVGVIPHYARNGEGGLDATVLFYRELA
jgi:acetyltransferase